MTFRISNVSAFFFAVLLSLTVFGMAQDQKDLSKEDWWKAPEFDSLRPTVVAVVPMVNMSLDNSVAPILQAEVYSRLQAKGYRKIDADQVRMVMTKLGIQTPEQLAGISYARLGNELNCDAVIQGQVNQAGTQHQVVYDAVVYSCSLQLIHCATGKPLWRCEQFRAAHRQWQLDPFNAFINFVGHEQAAPAERIAWLVQEMFRTLPEGPVQVVTDNLLSEAIQIDVDISEPLKKLEAKVDEEVIEIDLSSDILFDFDKYEIRDDAQGVLKNLIPIMNKYPKADVRIVGHTDYVGTEAYNLDLSKKRAESCKAWILQRIVPAGQTFATEGLGKSQPKVSNDTPENRQKNRRVELTIKKNDK